MISGLGRWLSCVGLLGVLCGQARAAVPPEILDLAMQPPVVNITPGPEYSDAQRDYAMTIGIERTQKGRLWAAWVGGGDSDKGYFVAASSDDEGRTWSQPRFVIDPPDVPNGLRRRILVGNFWCDPTGKLWLFFDQSMGYFDGRAGAWAITCENPDAANPNWSAPRRLWHGMTLNKPTVLKNGDWLMPVSLWTRDRIGPKELREGFRELDDYRMANWFVSTDKGANWTRRGGVVVPQSDFDEHMTVELKDGRLWMLARTKYGIAETFSPDGGRTWTEPKPSAIQNPSARFFLRRLASGRILLVKNGPLDQRTGRTQMTAFLSEDEGKSWQGGLVFEERNGVSYPDGFQAPDGRIFISYDRERAKEREILMAVFTEADVLAGKAVSPEARLKVLISKALGPLKTGSSRREEAQINPPVENRNQSLLTSAATNGKRPAPYPPSPVIAGIEWAPTNRIVRVARDGDNWPLTWADDDALYTTWGDGTGFVPKVEKKLSMGFARVTGTAEKFTGVNVRSDAEQLGQGRAGKKGWGLLGVDSVLYLWLGHADNKGAMAQLAWSRDHAKTWTFADWKFPEFGMMGFVNYGRNYAGARDEFVYAYSHDDPRADTPADRFILLRAPKDKLTTRAAWEFFAKLDAAGQPVWTRDLKQRGAVFQHPGACLRSAMTYNAPLKRYLWWQHLPQPPGVTNDRGDTRFTGGFAVYDAPEPWGPWSTAFFTEKWDVGPGEHGDFPAKWMSADGRSLHLVFSGDDTFAVRAAQLKLR